MVRLARPAVLSLVAAVVLSLFAAALFAAASAPARSRLSEPVPDSVIVTANGLEWVWAGSCAGCWATPLLVGKDGFNYATPAQWPLHPPAEAFGWERVD